MRPGAQLLQALAPAPAYRPAAHDAHALKPLAFPNEPVAHASQLLRAAADDAKPTAHGVHAVSSDVAPVVEPNEPARHCCAQMEAPDTLESVEGAHETHLDAPAEL